MSRPLPMLRRPGQYRLMKTVMLIHTSWGCGVRHQSCSGAFNKAVHSAQSYITKTCVNLLQPCNGPRLPASTKYAVELLQQARSVSCRAQRTESGLVMAQLRFRWVLSF